MNDVDNLLSSSDYSFKPKGKCAPMAPHPFNNNHPESGSLNSDSIFRSASSYSSNRNNRDEVDYSDLFGGAGKSDKPFSLDSFYDGPNAGGSRSPPPVYDKPVYDDDDIFDGVPGLKTTSKVQVDNIFASEGVGSGGGDGGSGAFEDLVGEFGKGSKSSGGKRLGKDDRGVSDVDDLKKKLKSKEKEGAKRKKWKRE